MSLGWPGLGGHRHGSGSFAFRHGAIDGVSGGLLDSTSYVMTRQENDQSASLELSGSTVGVRCPCIIVASLVVFVSTSVATSGDQNRKFSVSYLSHSMFRLRRTTRETIVTCSNGYLITQFVLQVATLWGLWTCIRHAMRKKRG